MDKLFMKEDVKMYCDKHQCTEDCKLKPVCDEYGAMCFADERGILEAYGLLHKKKETVNEVNSEVNHPSHYNQGDVECIDAMKSAFGKEAVKDFCLCNAFKYIWRSRSKNGIEDIQKAKWYLNKFKELEEDAE